MKVAPEWYAKVFLELAKGKSPEETDKIIGKLARLVAKNGDLPARKKILEAAEREARKMSGKHLLTIETAHEMPDKFYADLLKKIGNGAYDVRRLVNEDLIAGAKLSIDESRELDVSFRNVLKNLFDRRNI